MSPKELQLVPSEVQRNTNIENDPATKTSSVGAYAELVTYTQNLSNDSRSDFNMRGLMPIPNAKSSQDKLTEKIEMLLRTNKKKRGVNFLSWESIFEKPSYLL